MMLILTKLFIQEVIVCGPLIFLPMLACSSPFSYISASLRKYYPARVRSCGWHCPGLEIKLAVTLWAAGTDAPFMSARTALFRAALAQVCSRTKQGTWDRDSSTGLHTKRRSGSWGGFSGCQGPGVVFQVFQNNRAKQMNMCGVEA